MMNPKKSEVAAETKQQCISDVILQVLEFREGRVYASIIPLLVKIKRLFSIDPPLKIKHFQA